MSGVAYGLYAKVDSKLKTLPQVVATAEQLPLISQNRRGVEIICGAAGSGKTSTALLRLRSLSYMFDERNQREQRDEPVRVLVLTFNSTLAGYVTALAEQQIQGDGNISIEIDTFGRWARNYVGATNIVDSEATREKLESLARGIDGLSRDYVVKEVEYVLGRFEPEDLEDYIVATRAGRGSTPRVLQGTRRIILDEVIFPYLAWLEENESLDWNLLAVKMAREITPLDYDIIVVDETQDFSANQLRAVRQHLAAEHAITFVIDTVQRIYARGFTWAEAGFDVRPERSHVLRINHRNTAEIAAFAAGILEGISVDTDGALPDLTATNSHGPRPIVLKGRYFPQLNWAIDFINNEVNLAEESVAFLKPRGQGWFKDDKNKLSEAGIEFVDITRNPDWPDGDVNVALSTFHSAKGLEFDYVFILGISAKNAPFADEDSDDQILLLRRLLAVAVARARKQVIVGYKPGEESQIIEFFVPGTFDELML